MTFEEAIEFYNEGFKEGSILPAFMAVLQKVADLDAKLDRLQERFDGLLETYGLWDGS
jgi:hypothetical protein